MLSKALSESKKKKTQRKYLILIGLSLLIVFFGVVASVYLVQLQQDLRQQAFNAQGNIQVTYQAPQTVSLNQEQTITFQIDTNAIPLTGLQLSFEILGSFSQPPTPGLDSTLFQGYQTIYRADPISGGYRVSYAVLGGFVNGVAQPINIPDGARNFATLRYTPSATGQISLNFLSDSAAPRFDNNQDELRIIPNTNISVVTAAATATPAQTVCATPQNPITCPSGYRSVQLPHASCTEQCRPNAVAALNPINWQTDQMRVTASDFSLTLTTLNGQTLFANPNAIQINTNGSRTGTEIASSNLRASWSEVLLSNQTQVPYEVRFDAEKISSTQWRITQITVSANSVIVGRNTTQLINTVGSIGTPITVSSGISIPLYSDPSAQTGLNGYLNLFNFSVQSFYIDQIPSPTPSATATIAAATPTPAQASPSISFTVVPNSPTPTTTTNPTATSTPVPTSTQAATITATATNTPGVLTPTTTGVSSISPTPTTTPSGLPRAGSAQPTMVILALGTLIVLLGFWSLKYR